MGLQPAFLIMHCDNSAGAVERGAMICYTSSTDEELLWARAGASSTIKRMTFVTCLAALVAGVASEPFSAPSLKPPPRSSLPLVQV